MAKSGTALSEHDSKKLLARHGIPVTREIPVRERRALKAATEAVGYPLVLKGCSPGVPHKTEKGWVHLDIRNDREAEAAFDQLHGSMGEEGSVLVQEMVRGQRELAAGMIRDPQFGPCVMFGLGGIFTELFGDVVFRVAPLDRREAAAMMRDIRGQGILDAFRGMAPADLDATADILVRLGEIGVEHPGVLEIDINPLVLADGRPVAVDALVVLRGGNHPHLKD